MQTPGEKLATLLQVRGIQKTELAQRIESAGLGPCSYQRVYKWCKNREFVDENRQKVIIALHLPPTFFENAEAALRREKAYQVALKRWLTSSPWAAKLTEADVEVLRRMPLREDADRAHPAFFDSVAAALLGKLRPNKVSRTADLNVGLDRTLASKPPLKHRR